MLTEREPGDRKILAMRAMLGAAALLVFAPLAVAATPAQNAAFAKQLRPQIKPVFEKQAPQLVLGKVTCLLPRNGNVIHCKAHFTYPKARANIVYLIKATLLDTGKLKWTTTSHSCTDARSGKKLPC
jgi:hypothetical protein